MNTCELFSGTQSFSKVMRAAGHKTFCIEYNLAFKNDLTIDILRLDTLNFLEPLDVLWSSPPCTSFSVASMGHHWNEDRTSKTYGAYKGLRFVNKTIDLIKEQLERNPDMIWFIENPRGMLRKIIGDVFKENNLDYVQHTVTYCQYGDTRMKPTDIWTNCKTWKPRPMCKPGDDCHEKAPRGSRTGTQGLKGNKERSVIPPQLFEEILEQIK